MLTIHGWGHGLCPVFVCLFLSLASVNGGDQQRHGRLQVSFGEVIQQGSAISAQGLVLYQVLLQICGNPINL